ncbi:MAG: M23 family metallopeptidase [Leptospiraceae bacterium]|nr:M23 family metallopeptidase [Leptospiraceae bacterium]
MKAATKQSSVGSKNSPGMMASRRAEKADQRHFSRLSLLILVLLSLALRCQNVVQEPGHLPEPSDGTEQGQDTIPTLEEQNVGLHPPLNPPLVLTGTTGEFRRSHFHYGIDLSSKIGDPVYSVRKGYIKRILYDGYGLGYGIWVMHPDGRESKYGHLSAFAPELLQRMMKIRPELEEKLLKRQHFDIRFLPDALNVKRGQQIALTGDTGSGPSHLHFEYLQGDVVLNPLKYGLKIADNRAPLIESLILIPCDEGSSVNGKSGPTVLKPKEITGCGEADKPCTLRRYSVSEVFGSGKLCAQIQYFDPSGKYARLGIASLQMIQDGRPIYASSFRTLKHLGMFRHLTLYSESSRIGRGTVYIQNLFDLLPGHFPFLSSVDHGRIHVGQSETEVIIKLLDASGNGSEMSFSIKPAAREELTLLDISRKKQSWAPYTMEERLSDSMNPSAGVGRPGKALSLRSPDGKLKLELGSSALVGAVRIEMTQKSDGPGNEKLKRLSPVYSLKGRNLDRLPGMIFEDRIFLLEPLRIQADGLSDSDGLFRITSSGALFPVAYARNGKVTGYVRTLESYVIMRDQSAPSIRQIPELSTPAGVPLLLSLRYFGDYGTGVNVSSLRLEVNGKPALAEYDPDRYGYEIFYPPEILQPGNHEAKISVKDYAGNESGTKTFRYSVR